MVLSRFAANALYLVAVLTVGTVVAVAMLCLSRIVRCPRCEATATVSGAPLRTVAEAARTSGVAAPAFHSSCACLSGLSLRWKG